MADDVELEQEAEDPGQDPDPKTGAEQPMSGEPAQDEPVLGEPVSEELPTGEGIEAASDDTTDDARDSLDERIPQIEVDDEAEADEADEAESAETDVADAEDVDTEADPSDTALPDIESGPDSPKVPWWPFLALLAVWLGVVTGSFFTLSYESAAAPLIHQEAYPYVILAGLVLAILGPIVSLTVWFVMWMRAGKGHREGLLTASLVRGAGVTLLGVLAWWSTIVALDALRLGLIG